MAAKNEFEGLDDEEAPAQEFSEGTTAKDNQMATPNRGMVYDYNSGPDTLKAPPRIDLNGKIVTIKKAEIVLPPIETKWEWTRDKSKEFKFCMFVLYFDIAGQQEYVPGIRTFKRMEGNVAKYSHPTVPRDRESQASKMLGMYADYRKKDINEITMKEFMSFLNSSPKALIKLTKVMNPRTKEEVSKNLVDKFVD
jgi:hypothetical protein